jgi:hypothetical protein
MAALNVGGFGAVTSISCPAAHTCAAGGYYKDSSHHGHAFVANETNGTWRKAVEVPGTAALNVGHDAQVSSVSCAIAGSCSAGGYYTDNSLHAHRHAFVVNEISGAWRKAVQVPGVAALNTVGDARVTSISCPSRGNCAAGGIYHTGGGLFVVNEKNGVWGKAMKVPGAAALNVGRDASLTSVSCASTGNCAAGGRYKDGSAHYQAYVVSEQNGRWTTNAKEVPGTANLNLGGNAQVTSISCTGTTSCVAGGNYEDGSGHNQAFVASSKNGVWSKAIIVPGTPAAVLVSGVAQLSSISCRSAGNCSAGGYYDFGGGNNRHAFVVSSTNGVWGTATEVPGIDGLGLGTFSQVTSISCAGVGNCAVVGSFDSSGDDEAFAAAETNGVWGQAVPLGGAIAFDWGPRPFFVPGQDSISCAKAGACAIGGDYEDDQSLHADRGLRAYVTTP